MDPREFRALTVKPEFLSKILAGEKVWEIRSSNAHFKGAVVFAANGSGRLWGAARRVSSGWLHKDALLTPRARKLHGLQEDDLAFYGCTAGAWVWV